MAAFEVLVGQGPGVEPGPAAGTDVPGAKEMGAGFQMAVQVRLGDAVVVADLAHVVFDSWREGGFSWEELQYR